MRLPFPLTVTLVLLFSCLFYCHRANAQATAAKKNQDATVSGKVTIKGKPAPGIVVGLRVRDPAQSDPTFKATTDDEGKYRIINLPSGTYLAAPAAPSFVISDVNNSSGHTVIIAEKEKVENIDFDLMRGGVITGKVADADGHPFVEEHVTLFSIDPGNQRWSMSAPSSNGQTDDRGIYRIFGIPPGRYQVSVGEGENRIGRGHPAHLITFYPDVTDVAKATVVAIDEGTEAAKIDITVGEPVQGFSVSGRIVDAETGKPMPNVAINLMRIVTLDAKNSRSYGGRSDAPSDVRGEFHLEKVPKGKYSISVVPRQQSDLRAEPVTFDVVDQDVTGLLIKTSVGASLSGTVVFEGNIDKNATTALERAYIFALIRKDESNASWSSADWLPRDGSFRLGGLQSGIATLSVATMSSAKGLQTLRIERDGVVQPNGIKIQTGEQIAGIRVVVGYVNGSIRGVVKLENGTLPPSGRFSIQLTKPGDASFRVQPWVVDSRGHFLIDGLAAGSYELSVSAYAPEWRTGPRSAKETVTVNEGAATDVVITIDLTPTPNP